MYPKKQTRANWTEAYIQMYRLLTAHHHHHLMLSTFFSPSLEKGNITSLVDTLLQDGEHRNRNKSTIYMYLYSNAELMIMNLTYVFYLVISPPNVDDLNDHWGSSEIMNYSFVPDNNETYQHQNQIGENLEKWKKKPHRGQRLWPTQEDLLWQRTESR